MNSIYIVIRNDVNLKDYRKLTEKRKRINKCHFPEYTEYVGCAYIRTIPSSGKQSSTVASHQQSLLCLLGWFRTPNSCNSNLFSTALAVGLLWHWLSHSYPSFFPVPVCIFMKNDFTSISPRLAYGVIG